MLSHNEGWSGLRSFHQNERYLARLTSEQRERRNRRKALQAQRRRLEAKIRTAQDQLREVVGALAALDGTSNENASS